jgi:hypothetical protein
MKNSLIFFYTVAFGFTVLSIDLSNDALSITPLFSLSWLMLNAFHQSKRRVFYMLFILAGFVVISLHDQTPSLMYLRTLSFVLGGTLAALFSGSRENANEIQANTIRIIEQLPALVVAADSNGTIVAASEKILNMVKEHYSPLLGHSFADVFMGEHSPGDAVRIYHEWMQSGISSDEIFCLRDGSTISFSGKPMISGSGKNKLLTAVFTVTPRTSQDTMQCI